MKARVTVAQRIDPKLMQEMRNLMVEEANQLIRKESSDVMFRATNMCLLAMARVGLSPKTAKRVVVELEEYVAPMWNRYIQPDKVTGKGDGDWAIISKLKEQAYPYYQPETEM